MYANLDSSTGGRAALQQGWVIANHILVSFHVAFISSVLALPAEQLAKGEVLRFIFFSHETAISALFVWLTFHAGIALHEMGHLLTALRLNALNEAALEHSRGAVKRGRIGYYLKLFLQIPYGKAVGVKKEGLNYYADAPFNLAVAAAGPRASRNVALVTLPPAVALIAAGLLLGATVPLYVGRLLLGVGLVALLDFRMADPGKYRAFAERERRAEDQAKTVERLSGWYEQVGEVKRRVRETSLQTVVHPRLGPVSAPWQYRNCGMGGRHTEKEYPESNISMQEAMFLIIGARDYLEGQEMTVQLQTRLKEIIESEEGCRVMGIGLEGGLAPYIDRGGYRLPELRLWAMMKQAIEQCGYRPGLDVAIALDPAMSELEIAYRQEYEVADAVGMYLFWRDKSQLVLDREGVLEVYLEAIRQHEIPILSIEDGFSEDDHEGWKLLLERLGDRVLVIGDDLVTTNDKTIEVAADAGLINAALIKANQIGTLSETLLAMLVALGKGLDLVVSHRSKSPNDDMEAQIALAVNALGLKAGGGSNTERLVKYQGVVEQMLRVADASGKRGMAGSEQATVERLMAYEEPTNAGIPTVGVTAELRLREAGLALRFRGATPLGTSAGTGEAIHLVDSLIERAEHREVVDRFSAMFRQVEPGVYSFIKGIDPARIEEAGDSALAALYRRASRYNGKGCLGAVDNALEIIAPHFVGRDAATISLADIDRGLLQLELQTARRRGKRVDDPAAGVALMQRKQNLGMNAILSTSLAMARAVAHVHGRELYELLREEMMAIVDRLAAAHGRSAKGTAFADYAAVLREVTAALDAQGIPLHEELRRLTGIYGDAPAAEVGRPASAPLGPVAEEAPAEVEVEAPQAGAAALSESAASAAGAGAQAESAARSAEGPQGDSVDEEIARVNRALARAFVGEGAGDPIDGLRRYLEVKRALASRLGTFGVVNNRLFVSEDFLVAPYLVERTLRVCVVRAGESVCVASEDHVDGQIFTDGMVLALAGIEPGEVTPVDIEDRLMVVKGTKPTGFRIARMADIAAVLKRVNDGVNRNEAVFWLRHLVARLCNVSVRSFVRAKNIQPEIKLVVDELVRLTNSALGRRLPLLMRILVRNLPILIGKPNLIDRLWNDTIALAEVEVRGSAIVNELRRTSHHALGPRTLRIARAYLAFLETAEDWSLRELGFDAPSQADLDARLRDEPRQILLRVIEDIEGLLGQSEAATRLRDWQERYVDAYLRCPYGSRLDEQVETLVRKGIAARSRWAYLHHLRILQQKVDDLDRQLPGVAGFGAVLAELEGCPPDEEGFDAEAVEGRLRQATGELLAGLRQSYGRLFERLDALLDAHERQQHEDAFEWICAARTLVASEMARPAFCAQRYHLIQADCLLEELGYLALRQFASVQEERGVELEACLDVIHRSALSLRHDGLFSQELSDLSSMLVDPNHSDGELLDILVHIQRCYHKIRQRVTAPFEHMQQLMGLDDDELRAILANMQRYMHDLNGMVQLANITETFIRAQRANERATREVAAVAAIDGGLDRIIHISHRAAIARSVGPGADGPNLRALYGGKGSGLLYISERRIPTRDGFILPTTVARSGLHSRQPERLEAALRAHLETLEGEIAGRAPRSPRFGDPSSPLLLAVRGGSVFSMPGILSTVVFVGINDAVAATLAEDEPWGAYDTYRRFLASYASVVWDFDVERFGLVEAAKRRCGVRAKQDLPWEAMKQVAEQTKAVLGDNGFGDELERILAEPTLQLYGAVEAVMASWDGPTARRYREIKGLCDDWCTAVIVQEMAFGNRANAEVGPGMDETSASLTGVIPGTRETEIGVRELAGEFKFSAAGDDLVGGAVDSFRQLAQLQEVMPMLQRRLRHIVAKMRRLMGTDQEIEFTVDRGVLSVLQARTASTRAEIQQISFVEPGVPAARGLGVCGSGFRGLAAFSDADREELAAVAVADRDDVDGTLMILENPTPEDIPTIISTDGLLTAKGGSTSHAAVAANQIVDRGFAAVMSVGGLRVDSERSEAVIVDEQGGVRHRIRRGEIVSIHGTSGEVYVGSRRVDLPAPAPKRLAQTSNPI